MNRNCIFYISGNDMGATIEDCSLRLDGNIYPTHLPNCVGCKDYKSLADVKKQMQGDWVQVVRCKDCSGIKRLESPEGQVAYCCTRAWGLKGLISFDDFCPNGEKRRETIDTEPHWVYWDGWISNTDRRIDDAVCSNCGFKHPIVRRTETENFTPNLLYNYCPSCRKKMKKC